MTLGDYSLPSAISPAYSIGDPNQSIQLYEGLLEISQEGLETQGTGSVYFKWFPYPCVEFSSPEHESVRFDQIEAFLKLPEASSSAKVLMAISDRSSAIRRVSQVLGKVKEPLVFGSGKDLNYIVFHLTNFDNFYFSSRSLLEIGEERIVLGRVCLKAGGWRITIDELSSADTNEKFLKSQGGYAVTHAGKLEQESGENFSVDDARDFLEALSYFLSFVQGFRISPLLLVGYNSDTYPVWREWASSNADPWKSVFTWAWGVPGKNIEDAFSGFYSWWHNWGDSAKLAIHWYIESNTQAGGIEGACVLEQAALELLAWKIHETDFMNKENQKKKPQFDRASKQINHLLSERGVPQNIPSELTNLVNLAHQQKWTDNGASAFINVRNNIAHADPKNRLMLKSIPFSVKVEAWLLGLWYVELTLLQLFNYQGKYFNRLPRRTMFYGELESVPWI